MKPSFALSLSNERVGLLHRTSKGWLEVGEAAFDSDDLSGAMAYMRRTALGLSPRGLASKLLIPNSEILYLEIEAPGPDDDSRKAQIRDGLAGKTPYPADELVFDWRGRGPKVKVAVVAKRTLAEAEAFAVEHRFHPVSFAAVPDASVFRGEPFFGVTGAAPSILSPGESVEPDRELLHIVSRDLPPTGGDAPASKVKERARKAEPKAEEPPPETAMPVVDPAPEPEPVPEPAPVPVSEPAPVAEPAAERAESVESFADTYRDVGEEPDPVAAATPSAAPGANSASPGLDQAPVADSGEAPYFHVADGVRVDSDPDDDLPPAPAPAIQMAFASRRGGEVTSRIVPQPDADRPLKGSAADWIGSAMRAPAGERPAPVLRAVDPASSAPALAGAGKRKLSGVEPPPAVAAAAAALQGANSTKPVTRPRGSSATQRSVGGKPRFLGLILTGLLLLVLALVAAWSSYYLARNDDAPATLDTAESGEAAPIVEPEALADGEDPEALADLQGTDAEPAEAEAEIAAIEEPAEAAPDEAGTELPAETVEADPPAPEAVPGAEIVPETEATAEVAPADADPVAPPASTELAAEAAPEATEVTETTDSAEAVPAPDAATAPPAASDADVAVTESPDAPVEDTAPAPALADADAAGTEAPAAAAPLADAATDEVMVAGSEATPAPVAPVDLPVPTALADAAPDAALPPPPFGTTYEFLPNGLVQATPEGIQTPEGAFVILGRPDLVPPARPDAIAVAAAAAAAAATVVPAPAPADAAPATASTAGLAVAPATAGDEPPPGADPALAGFRPRARPAGIAPVPAAPATDTADDAALQDDAPAIRVTAARPPVRPEAVTLAASNAQAASASAAASLTAQANAAVETAVASAEATGNPMALPVSRRPSARPANMSRAVEAALAAAAAEAPPVEAVAAAAPAPEPEAEPRVAAEPEADEEPEVASAAPRIPTKATVAKQATFANAINLSKVNLIGVFGPSNKRYALIRLANGSIKKVGVGDRVDGGRVAAITASEVRYEKGGRLVALKMPRG